MFKTSLKKTSNKIKRSNVQELLENSQDDNSKHKFNVGWTRMPQKCLQISFEPSNHKFRSLKYVL